MDQVVDSVIEFVKFFGELGGFASTAFIVYDRIYRYMPTAFLIPLDYKTSLRIKNIAPGTIVTDEIIVVPQIVRVARQRSYEYLQGKSERTPSEQGKQRVAASLYW
jgi:hypothetical protein